MLKERKQDKNAVKKWGGSSRPASGSFVKQLLSFSLRPGSILPETTILKLTNSFVRPPLLNIREYGSTLYVGLAHAVPPTNTNFQPLLLPSQAGMPYTNTYKHRTSYFKSTLTFMGPAKCWKCLSAARQKRQILAILQHNNNQRVR